MPRHSRTALAALLAMTASAPLVGLSAAPSDSGLQQLAQANDAYRPPASGQSSFDNGAPRSDAYSPPAGVSDSFGGSSGPPPPASDGYGEPYNPPSANAGQEPGYPEPVPPPQGSNTFGQNEVVTAGHQFFGSVSKELASAVEYVFQSQGRPNGYILGEDAGGALVFGLRYGEGTLYTKNAGTHKVFWQGPSVGYDAGAEGSKAMVLVYNLHDPSEIYERFGGVQGAAYLVGGVSVQLQKANDVTLAVIRSGVGLRLGANVGYIKYTRAPTWNPL